MATEHFLSSLSRLYPPGRLLTQPAALSVYEADALTAYRVRPRAVVLPETQDEVIETVRLCHQHNVPFVARGSGTGLSGGALPIEGGIIIGLNRLDRILHLDPVERIAVVEPGVINLAISQAAAPHGLYYAPDPSSQLVCTIGGNVAFNSGGAHCLKYGMTSNHVLGIRAVLADGEVIELGGRSLESVGPDLPGLFVGSEGLMGIALQITVRLVPKVETYRTVLAAYRSMEQAGRAVSMVVASGLLPGAIEIMNRLAIEAAEASVQAGYPADAAAVLIVELEGEAQQVEAEFRQLQEVIEESGAYEMRLARDDAQRAKIWKGRKGAFSAVGRLSPDYIVQDGVVPRGRLSQALAEIDRLSAETGIRVANVFHAGDGNLHPLILYDGRRPGAYDHAEELAGQILQLCIEMGGSITGEHGIGMEKRHFVPAMFDAATLDTMQRLRRAMDPAQIANRGKLFPPNGDAATVAPAGARPSSAVALRPATPEEVRAAVLAHRRLWIRGGGSKPALATPADQTTPILELSQLSGILEYEPEEFTITALAGTTVAEIQALLAEHGQYLPFDPPLADAGATLGGTVAAGLSGPGRYRYGGLRDFLLGVRFVDGQGNLVRGGGKVVKNVAGFDLPRPLVGSLGRLGVLTEVTFKVFPRPAAYATLRIEHDDITAALDNMAQLAVASLDIEAVDMEPENGKATLWVRIAGRADLLPARLRRLEKLLGEGDTLTGPAEEALWQGLRDFAWVPAGWSMLKVPLTLRRVAELEEQLAPPGIRRRYSVGGNVAWLASPPGLEMLDERLVELGLTGLLLRGAAGQPYVGARPDSEFGRRVKQVLDPAGRFPPLYGDR